MNYAAVYSRTAISWQLTFAHAGKMLQHLKSALLMSVASAGLGLAFFCSWLDRFLTGRRAGSWIISPRSEELPELRREPPLEHSKAPRSIAAVEKLPPIAIGRNQPRTIDSLIRDNSMRRADTGRAPLLH